MFSVSNNEIKLIRGDTLRLIVEIQNGDEPYVPAPNDVIRFAMKKAIEDPQPIILKTIPNDTLKLILDPEDTKGLAFGKYVYDIELTMADGTVDTFIPPTAFYIAKEVY